MTDELLVIRCRLGERDALARLVRQWHEPVLVYVRRMLGPAHAEDVAQEVWLAVLRGLPRLRQPERFTPWLYTIARRVVVNRLREEYARPEVPGEAAERAVPDHGDLVADRDEVARRLGGLPAREREVLILFHLEDLPLEACAEICGVPVGTVKSRLSRARRMVRAAIEAEGEGR
ncbi:sigma-70 family RNA polymerase sigma factor [Catellatospora sp. KI3]|uniref:RNA polymerase sigma factor n=1 Tax=Catellatospora sp. KI3 TaxID=3041620 RepID=UPI0024832AA2|nr:sigma-70 family RNA polymerase sigma factor [Catellatospora sp. KI3]MDI1464663.1 sigma-70 family RNA polymerase sigma factor [Catellatospora sp. KI3]